MLKVDPRDAATVIGLEGVDVPLPAPKSSRARAKELVERSTDVHDAVADPSESSVKVDPDASFEVKTGPGLAVWIGVAFAVLLVGLSLVYLLS